MAYSLYVGVAASEATDIYCGIRFTVNADNPVRPTDWLTLEHAYPAKWMVDAVGCTNSREECRKDANQKRRARFNHAEADLHNLWPANNRLNSSRGDRLFAEIPGDEERTIEINGRTFTCEYQDEGNFVEPRRIVRGNLARSIFYMCKEYQFPVNADMFKVLKKWNTDDPPTKAEKERNAKIAKIQGIRNRYIDNFRTADKLSCAAP